jgi:hypothetical protein
VRSLRIETDGGSPAWTWLAAPDRRVLAASIVLQLALGLLLGHANDTRVFMATGHLVAAGENPYAPQDLTAVFHRGLFDGGSTVGYPPPWPLVLGLIYALSYGLVPDLLVYNLAIKLPIIAANIGLAYLAGSLLQTTGSPEAGRKAWTFLLLNPLLLYFTAAWGQIDGVVALLALAALALLAARRWDASALLLALAVCVKPIALPVALAALVYVATRSRRAALRYGAVLAGAAVLLCVVPFLVAGWSPDPIVRGAGAVWRMSGALSSMSIVRAVRDPSALPGAWWLAGLAWIPALAVAVMLLRRGVGDVDDLFKKAVALVLVFYLTRTWLSAGNVVLLLPLVLILSLRGALHRWLLHALWLIPLAFSVVAWTPLRLLWVAFPDAMLRALDGVADYLPVVIVMLAALAIAWQVVGWWTVVTCLRGARASRAARAEGPGAIAARAPGAARAPDAVAADEPGSATGGLAP